MIVFITTALKQQSEQSLGDVAISEQLQRWSASKMHWRIRSLDEAIGFTLYLIRD